MIVISNRIYRVWSALTITLAGVLTALVLGGVLRLCGVDPRPLAVGIGCALLAWLASVPVFLVLLEDVERRRGKHGA